MKPILIATVALLAILTSLPSATAGPETCGEVISVDEVQECANMVIDKAQYTGGEKYREVQTVLEWTCGVVLGPENCG